jgi:hypothetical protein
MVKDFDIEMLNLRIALQATRRPPSLRFGATGQPRIDIFRFGGASVWLRENSRGSSVSRLRTRN